MAEKWEVVVTRNVACVQVHPDGRAVIFAEPGDALKEVELSPEDMQALSAILTRYIEEVA